MQRGWGEVAWWARWMVGLLLLLAHGPTGQPAPSPAPAAQHDRGAAPSSSKSSTQTGGAAIGGATIETVGEPQAKATTAADGKARLDVPPGTYAVKAIGREYGPVTIEKLTVVAGKAIGATAKLRPAEGSRHHPVEATGRGHGGGQGGERGHPAAATQGCDDRRRQPRRRGDLQDHRLQRRRGGHARPGGHHPRQQVHHRPRPHRALQRGACSTAAACPAPTPTGASCRSTSFPPTSSRRSTSSRRTPPTCPATSPAAWSTSSWRSRRRSSNGRSTPR